jgi:IrrE N-terminal-like domain
VLRKPHPYRAEQHENIANEVLLKYQQQTNWTRSLPIPIEQIIEVVYGLRIDIAVIEEAPGEKILGRLVVETKTIELNEKHLEPGGVLEQRGPLNFTYAHELGHWIYDVGDINQQELPFGDRVAGAVLCRDTGDDEKGRDLREINANKFASCLLMPKDLIDAAMNAPQCKPLWQCARDWYVSKQALRIRLENLGWEITEDF